MPIAVPRTLTDVRARIRAELGSVGIPAAHWSISTGQDCLGFLTWAAGLRQRDDYTTALISISAFRASAGWHEVRGTTDLRPGDWVLWDWNGDGDPDHAEFLYSLDRPNNELTTDSANTGPHPGDDIDAHPELRGVYEKTRPLSSPQVWGALRPPYAPTTVTSREKAQVRKAATVLNETMPSAYRDAVTGRTLTLHRTGAGDIGPQKGDGIPGPLYRLLVQVWGRRKGLYGDTYRLDGIFGPRSEWVQEQLFAAVRA